MSAAPETKPAITRPGALAASWLALHAAVFFALCTPAFETCDDVFLMDMASGRFTGEPSAYLVYTNVLLGGLLQGLYRLSKALPWYGLYLVAAQLSGWYFIARGALALHPGPRALILASLGFAVFGAPLLMALQYTSTAIFLALAALFYSAARQGQEWSWTPALAGGGALVFAGLIRAQSLHAALAFGAPMLLVFALRTRRLKRQFLWLLAVAALHAASLGAQDWAHRSAPEWRRFVAFEKVMWNLAGRPPMPLEKRGALKAIGWSSNDLEMVYSFYYADRDVVNLDSARAALEVAARNKRKIRGSRRRKKVRRILSRDYRLELWAALLMALAFLPGLKPRRILQLVLVGAWFFAVAILIEQRYDRLPERVLRPAWLAPWLAALLITELRAGSFGAETWPARSRHAFTLFGALRFSFSLSPPSWLRRAVAVIERLWRPVILAVVGAGFAFPVWGYARAHSATNQEHRRGYEADMARLQALDPQGVFVMWGPTGHYRVSPFQAPRDHPDVAVLRLTWPAQSPHWTADLKRRGLSHLTRGIIERADVYLVAAPDQLALFKTYALERFGIRVEARAVSLVSRCFVNLRGEHFAYCNCVLPVYEVQAAGR